MIDTLQTFRVAGFESQHAFDQIHAELTHHFNPHGPVESLFVLEMARSQWRIARYAGLETAVLNVSETLEEAAMKLHSGLTLGENLRHISRFEQTARQAYHRGHKELIAAQKLRDKTAPPTRVDAPAELQPERDAAENKLADLPLPPPLRKELDAHLRRDPFFDPNMDRTQLSAALRRWFEKHGHSTITQ